MMRLGLFLLLVLTTLSSHANVAVDQINGLLVKKASARHPERVFLREGSPEAGTVLDSGDPSWTRDDVAQLLRENYYFVFIYKGACPHCHNFAPILKDFTDSFHLQVTSYHLDDEPLNGFAGKSLTPDLFQALYVAGGYKPAVPALFLVNRHTLEAYAVLFGEATPTQLAQRVNELMLHVEEKFHA